MVRGVFIALLTLVVSAESNIWGKELEVQRRSRCDDILSTLQTMANRYSGDVGSVRQALQDLLPDIAYDLMTKEKVSGCELSRGYLSCRIRGARLDLLRKFYKTQKAHEGIGEDMKRREKDIARTSEGWVDLDTAEVNAELRRAIESLPQEIQELFRLKIVEGLTFTQITTVTGIPDGTLKSRYNRLLNHLQQSLTKLVSED